MVKKKELDLTVTILVLFGVSLLFVYTNPISQNIIDSAMWGLFAIGIVSGVVASGVTQKDSRIREFFLEESFSEAANRLAIGVVLGILFIFVMSFLLQGLGSFIYNATGSVSFSYIASMTEAEAYFVGYVQPVLETFVILVPFIALLSLFRRANLSWSMSVGIAFVLVALMFSAFHFSVRGKDFYENSWTSPNGYTAFIFNASPDAIQQGTTGFPQLLLGISFMVFGIYYRDFLVPVGAHLSNNLFAVYFSGLLSPGVSTFVLFGLIILALMVVYSFVTGNFLKYLVKGSFGEKTV